MPVFEPAAQVKMISVEMSRRVAPKECGFREEGAEPQRIVIVDDVRE